MSDDVTYKVRHKKTGEIISLDKECTNEYGGIEHNGFNLFLGFDGVIYDVQCGDHGIYVDNASDDYELIKR